MNRDQSVTVTNTAKDIPTSGVDTGNWVAGGILMAALMAMPAMAAAERRSVLLIWR
mgnify:CR=1 FL=1